MKFDRPTTGANERAPAARLTTFWNCDKRVNPLDFRNIAVFLHLTDGGAVWQTENHVLPVDYSPLSAAPLFDAGRHCACAHREQRAAGKVYFETGLYRPPNGFDRLWILNPQAGVPPDQVQIGAFMWGSPPAKVDVNGYNTIGATLGGGIELAAWKAGAVQGVLRMELVWRSLERTGANYTAFVHLIDSDGKIIARRDAPPGGINPTALWVPGEMITSTFDLPLPAGHLPPGQRVRIGLYLPSSGQQVPVTEVQAGSPATSGGTYLLLPLENTR